jgi:nucleotide-binding universal stress UspA family protein
MNTIDKVPEHVGRSGVMIATNAGPAAVATIRMGLALADHWHVPAAVVTVDPPDIAKVHERLAWAAGDGRNIPVYSRTGTVGLAIAGAADAWGAGLVVIGFGTGRHGTAAAIVRHANRSVLVVSPRELGTIGRVILTADFGGSTIEADQCALSLLAVGGHAELVHVTPELHLAPEIDAVWQRVYSGAVTELLERTRAALPHRERSTIPSRVTVGDAGRVLVDIARRERVDLIALGRHATQHNGFGPVLESVLEHAPCSVLVAPWRVGAEPPKGTRGLASRQTLR